MFFSDAIDDEPQFDGIQSFEGGMVSNQKPSSLSANQSVLIQNYDITKSGEITTRRGTALVGGGSVNSGHPIIRMTRFSKASGTEQLIASVNNGISGNRIYYYVDGGAWTLATTIPLTSGYAPIVQGIDKLYMRGSDAHLYSWDGTTATDLNAGGGNHPPLNGSAIEWFTDRLIVSDGRDAISFSDILDATNYPPENSIRIGAGETDTIMGVYRWTDFNLIVAKRRSLWIVNCDPTVSPAEFEIKCLHSKVGTRAPQTFVQVGSDVFGLTTHGVRSMKRTFAAETQSELGPSLSYPIEDYLDRINKAAISTACATYWKNRYILSVPLDTATTPNYTFVYNTLTNSWTGFWTGWYPVAFSERLITADGSLRMVFGDTNGYVYEWLDYVNVADEVDATFQDNGSSIATRLLTKAFNLGDPISPKTGLNFEVEYASTMNLITNQVADGTYVGPTGVLSGPITPETSAFRRKQLDLQSMGQWRELQIDMLAVGKKQTIRKIQVSAFIDTLQLQT